MSCKSEKDYVPPSLSNFIDDAESMFTHMMLDLDLVKFPLNLQGEHDSDSDSDSDCDSEDGKSISEEKQVATGISTTDRVSSLIGQMHLFLVLHVVCLVTLGMYIFRGSNGSFDWSVCLFGMYLGFMAIPGLALVAHRKQGQKNNHMDHLVRRLLRRIFPSDLLAPSVAIPHGNFAEDYLKQVECYSEENDLLAHDVWVI